LTDDARFWSWALVSVTIIALWAVESGRAGLLKTVWTTPDSKYQVGSNYSNGSSGGGSGGSSGAGTIGDIIGTLDAIGSIG
jgi:hypothetical protein